jgi:hypothetical protein
MKDWRDLWSAAKGENYVQKGVIEMLERAKPKMY